MQTVPKSLLALFFVFGLAMSWAEGVTSEQFDSYLLQAEAGDADAQALVGSSLVWASDWGLGIEENISKGIRWLTEAANQGQLDAQISLASIFDQGKKVDRDRKEALKWAHKAAENGDDQLQYQVGLLLAAGDEGIEQDKDAALFWLHQSALQGNAEARTLINRLYASGWKPPSSIEQPERWLHEAAGVGNLDAAFSLAMIYFRGDVFQKDHVKSRDLLLSAARSGHARSQANLALFYFDGELFPQDFVMAYKWANIASVSDDLSIAGAAKQLRDRVESRMSVDQVAEAQSKVRDFMNQ